MKSNFNFVLLCSALFLLFVTLLILFPWEICMDCHRFRYTGIHPLNMLCLTLMFLGILLLAFFHFHFQSKHDAEEKKINNEETERRRKDESDHKRYAFEQEQRNAKENYNVALEFFKYVQEKEWSKDKNQDWLSEDKFHALNQILEQHLTLVERQMNRTI
jgi:hypothetical protein